MIRGSRAVIRLEFNNCRDGLGVKITGGCRSLVTGQQFGVFVKRVISGGLAAVDGRIKAGDLILNVNNISLRGATNERAVDILRTASLSNHMTLLIARDEEARTQFSDLMKMYGSVSQKTRRTSPPLYTESMLLLSSAHSTQSSAHSTQSSAHCFSHSIIQLICVAKETGLGLVIRGGANQEDGPMVFIQEVVKGGDCEKDGRLQVGDQLVSVNKESLIGVTYEEASTLLTNSSLRAEPTVEVAFIRPRLYLGPALLQKDPTPPRPQPVPANRTLPSIHITLDTDSDAAPSSLCSGLEEAGSLTDLQAQCEESARLSPVDPSVLLDSTSDLQSCGAGMEHLRKQLSEALMEIRRLQEQVVEGQRVHLHMEAELNSARQEAKVGAEQIHSLSLRVLQSEELQKESRGMEKDYEEVIHLLEAEIAELKTERAEPAVGKERDKDEQLKKKVSVLECQLRKSEAAKKALEASVEKLLSFVETVKDFQLERPSTSSSSSEVKPLLQASPLHSRKPPQTAAMLAQEAEELRRTIRAQMVGDCLPYGWEEAFTADGEKYYISHVTQTTSWTRPVSSAGAEAPPPVSSEESCDRAAGSRTPSVETEM